MVFPVVQELDNAWITVKKLFSSVHESSLRVQSTSPVYESSLRNTLGPTINVFSMHRINVFSFSYLLALTTNIFRMVTLDLFSVILHRSTFLNVQEK